MTLFVAISIALAAAVSVSVNVSVNCGQYGQLTCQKLAKLRALQTNCKQSPLGN